MGTRISISRLFYLEQSSVSKLNLRFSKLPTWCLSVWGHLLNLSSIKLRWPSMQTFKLLFKMRCPFIFKHSLQLSFPASVPLLSLPLSLGCRSPPSHFQRSNSIPVSSWRDPWSPQRKVTLQTHSPHLPCVLKILPLYFWYLFLSILFWMYASMHIWLSFCLALLQDVKIL